MLEIFYSHALNFIKRKLDKFAVLKGQAGSRLYYPLFYGTWFCVWSRQVAQNKT